MLEHSLLNHKDMFDVSENEISSIVLRSEGKSFADLENVIEAALREAIRADVIVNDSLLDETFEELFYGEEWEDSSQESLRHTAYHEAGHALIALFYWRSPRYMSIVARGSQGGYVLQDAIKIINENKDALKRLADAVINSDEHYLTEDEIKAAYKG